VRIVVPEIADYELRRELLRARRTKGLANLQAFYEIVDYLPITTEAMRKAAEFWAISRQQGQPTSADEALDADVILAAQAFTLQESMSKATNGDAADMVIATTNVKHLSRFVTCDHWSKISPEVNTNGQ
jgi:predicted nucleic acid-binding protein